MNVEEWKSIIVNEIEWNYEISNLGNLRIKSNKKYRSLSTSDYVSIMLFKNNIPKKFYIHVLVALSFVHNDDPINKTQVNHLNYNKHDNRSINLEWISSTNNNKHSHLKSNRKSNKKAILRYNLDNNKNIIPESVKEYESLKQAHDDGFGSRISKCLTGEILSACGYFWTYKEPQSHKVPLTELDLSIFKDIIGHSNYLISIDGRVYNKSRQRFLFPQSVDGYFQIRIQNKSYRVHTLVINNFSNEIQSEVVNHKDGNKQNNHIDNLEYSTQSENSQHAYKTGLRKSHKSILQFDLNGNFIREFRTATEASISLGKCIITEIGKSCKDPNFKKTSGGFKWRYKTEELIVKYNLKSHNCTQV